MHTVALPLTMFQATIHLMHGFAYMVNVALWYSLFGEKIEKRKRINFPGWLELSLTACEAINLQGALVRKRCSCKGPVTKEQLYNPINPLTECYKEACRGLYMKST